MVTLSYAWLASFWISPGSNLYRALSVLVKRDYSLEVGGCIEQSWFKALLTLGLNIAVGNK